VLFPYPNVESVQGRLSRASKSFFTPTFLLPRFIWCSVFSVAYFLGPVRLNGQDEPAFFPVGATAALNTLSFFVFLCSAVPSPRIFFSTTLLLPLEFFLIRWFGYCFCFTRPFYLIFSSTVTTLLCQSTFLDRFPYPGLTMFSHYPTSVGKSSFC